ncbi:MAG: histidine--tRNA ligase [Bacteroidetes bacterium GWC2_33_15]|nr:MAG: histidine--tRNA ligase [Bacteroidetes bacterium GWA2_33_15]OFX52430.1 MAG: histidine--tRNA ligase [Bacteroidetes bacterium GWC2_33_15]OFX65492.1 MAG: histidine--tRNA ligase [Bacteroidetes bacterium GWB2_32_14]OFX67511.1 MAG: histidine--tRNA ligase [Bacteroidetes bacterium GWD2_33_33]HAN18446.1 histidine--tRNA ligase [Bacteroidales bacterium]
MAAQKPSVPKGTRDFSPLEMVKRNFIFDTIKDVFKRYGYLPIETPSMENLSTLLGKYGDEGDKLLFKILNSGDYLEKVNNNLKDIDSNKLALQICEKGLRYDLTVPFARYVVQHLNEITFPFKRYQVQPVWRADRPQKGRYREFYQCDVDVIGSNSLLNEVELIQIIDQVFQSLKVNVVIKMNNRKILAGIAEVIGEPDKIIDITIAIDKLEKIGKKGVYDELIGRGLSSGSISEIDPILELKGDNFDKLSSLKKILRNSEIGLKGIDELETILNYFETIDINTELELDLTLARGLNYYTGAIIEVKALEVEIGSICGGGRYDDLTGVFGLKDVSGVGVSFGADRIYDVMEQLDSFPKEIVSSTKVLFVNFGENEEKYCLPLLKILRDNGVNSEIYPDSAKMNKQMTYANNKNIPFVILVGENEMQKGVLTVKNMVSGEQFEMKFDELLQKLK